MQLTDILPNELLYTVFTYLDSCQLGRARRTSYRWCAIGHDPYLRKQHPLVDGQFKEKMVYDMITQDSNDLEYLVGLNTVIFRALKINKMEWCLITDAAGYAARCAAIDVAGKTASVSENAPYVLPFWRSRTASAASNAAAYPGWSAAVTARDTYENAAWGAARDATWDATLVDTMVATSGKGLAAWDIAIDAAAIATDNVAWDASGNTIAYYLHMWRNHTSQTIGKKACQIAECLMLISINQKFLTKIQTISKGLDCTIPEEKLDELCHNPWIKQYVELYH